MRISIFVIASTAILLTGCKPANEAATSANATAPRSGTVELPAAAKMQKFQCGEHAVTATFHGDTDTELAFSGRTMTLPHVTSASGAKYADDKGNEFWSKGPTEATLTLAGEDPRTCTGAG